MLAAGLFAKGELMERTGFSTSHQGLFYEIFRGSFNFNLIIAQLAGLGFVIGWTLVTMTLFPLATAKLGILRLVSVQKKESLDASRHPGADEDLSEDEKVRDVEEPSTSNDNDVAVA